jgi:hypothetical protein
MTKLEMTIRQVSDLRDFYLRIKKGKIKKPNTGATNRGRPLAKPGAER